MAEAVVDVLEVVHVDHGEREPALQILEPLVVIAAVVDLGDRVHILLPVAHEQLVEHIFALEHVVALDALDQLERIRPAVHLDEQREHIIDIALARFDLRLWLVRAQHLLRNAVFAAAFLFPHRVAVLALFKRVALIRFRQLHTDRRGDQPRNVKDTAIPRQKAVHLLLAHAQHVVRRAAHHRRKRLRTLVLHRLLHVSQMAVALVDIADDADERIVASRLG